MFKHPLSRVLEQEMALGQFEVEEEEERDREREREGEEGGRERVKGSNSIYCRRVERDLIVFG